MTELSDDQRRVLSAIGAYPISGPETLIAELRCAFTELEMLKLIEPVPDYRLTDAGKAALKTAQGKQAGE